MKKIFYISSMALTTLFGVGCQSFQQEDLFEKSASERIESSVNEYHQALISSEHGWVFENYPGGANQELGGFVYTLQFTENQVSAMLDLDPAGSVRTSTYSVIPHGGATLSFDEANPLLHTFSIPNEERTKGFSGDFEFLFVSKTDDEIIVKGKRYSDYLRLFRLKEPALNYISKVREIRDRILSSGFLRVQIGEESVDFDKRQQIPVLSYTKADQTTINLPYNYTDKGIRFYKPVNVNGKMVQELVFEDGTLKDADNLIVIYMKGPSPIDFQNSRWRFFVTNPEQASAKIKALYDAQYPKIVTELADPPFNLNLYLWDRYMFGNSTAGRAQGVGFYLASHRVPNPITPGVGVIPALYFLSFAGDAGNPNVLYMESANGSSGITLDPYEPILNQFLDNSPYTVEKTANPRIVKLTSQKDPEIWMVMEKYWP